MNSGELKAKKFFIEKVLLQAQKEHVPISEAERYMLSWTEDTGKDFSPRQDLTDQFEKETTQSAFEKKIVGLLKNAYISDVRREKEMSKKYRSALRALDEGDHYIAVMADRAVREGVVSANRLKDRMSLIITAVTIMAILLTMLFIFRTLRTAYLFDFVLYALVYLSSTYVFAFRGIKPHGKRLIALILTAVSTLFLGFVLFYLKIIPPPHVGVEDKFYFVIAFCLPIGEDYLLDLIFDRKS